MRLGVFWLCAAPPRFSEKNNRTKQNKNMSYTMGKCGVYAQPKSDESRFAFSFHACGANSALSARRPFGWVCSNRLPLKVKPRHARPPNDEVEGGDEGEASDSVCSSSSARSNKPCRAL